MKTRFIFTSVFLISIITSAEEDETAAVYVESVPLPRVAHIHFALSVSYAYVYPLDQMIMVSK